MTSMRFDRATPDERAVVRGPGIIIIKREGWSSSPPAVQMAEATHFRPARRPDAPIRRRTRGHESDSAFIENKWCYNIIYYPRRKSELTFKGDFWVNDTTFAIKDINMQASKSANIN